MYVMKKFSKASNLNRIFFCKTRGLLFTYALEIFSFYIVSGSYQDKEDVKPVFLKPFFLRPKIAKNNDLQM